MKFFRSNPLSRASVRLLFTIDYTSLPLGRKGVGRGVYAWRGNATPVPLGGMCRLVLTRGCVRSELAFSAHGASPVSLARDPALRTTPPSVVDQFTRERPPAAFAALHRGKASTLIGRETRVSSEGNGTFTAQNLQSRFLTERDLS